MNNDCRSCYFYYQCNSRHKCEDYTPIEGGLDDEMIDEFIEEQRAEFLNEWFEYIEEYED